MENLHSLPALLSAFDAVTAENAAKDATIARLVSELELAESRAECAHAALDRMCKIVEVGPRAIGRARTNELTANARTFAELRESLLRSESERDAVTAERDRLARRNSELTASEEEMAGRVRVAESHKAMVCGLNATLTAERDQLRKDSDCGCGISGCRNVLRICHRCHTMMLHERITGLVGVLRRVHEEGCVLSPELRRAIAEIIGQDVSQP